MANCAFAQCAFLLTNHRLAIGKYTFLLRAVSLSAIVTTAMTLGISDASNTAGLPGGNEIVTAKISLCSTAESLMIGIVIVALSRPAGTTTAWLVALM